VLRRPLWKVNEAPLPDHEYLLSMDTSLGLENGDPSAAHVFDRTAIPFTQVATFHGWISPREQARQAFGVAKVYNDALVAIEENNTGHAVITDVYNLGGRQVFQKMSQGVFGARRRRLGWYSSQASKHEAISRLRELLEHDEIVFFCPETLHEMNAYNYDRSRTGSEKIGVGRGRRDDRADAAAIAAHVMLSLVLREMEDEKPQRRPGMVVKLRGWQEEMMLEEDEEDAARTTLAWDAEGSWGGSDR